jgi:hypothetical protein
MLVLVLTLAAWSLSIGPSADASTKTVAAKSTDLPATLTGPSEMIAGSFAVFRLEVEATRVEWKCLSSASNDDRVFESFQSYHGMANGKPVIEHLAFFFPKRPGTYHVVAAAVGGDLLAHPHITVEVTGAGPQPDPDPGPDPDPPPPPVPGTKIVVVLHETGEASTVKAQVLQGLRTYLSSIPSIKWRIEDVDLTDPLIQSCLSKSKEAGLAQPVLGVATVSDAGEVVAFNGVKLPNTSAAAVNWIKEVLQ